MSRGRWRWIFASALVLSLSIAGSSAFAVVAFSDNAEEINALLCDDALARRRAVEQDYTRLVNIEGLRGPLPMASFLAVGDVETDIPVAFYSSEANRLKDVLIDAEKDILEFCGLDGPLPASLLTLREMAAAIAP